MPGGRADAAQEDLLRKTSDELVSRSSFRTGLSWLFLSYNEFGNRENFPGLGLIVNTLK